MLLRVEANGWNFRTSGVRAWQAAAAAAFVSLHKFVAQKMHFRCGAHLGGGTYYESSPVRAHEPGTAMQ